MHNSVPSAIASTVTAASIHPRSPVLWHLSCNYMLSTRGRWTRVHSPGVATVHVLLTAWCLHCCLVMPNYVLWLHPFQSLIALTGLGHVTPLTLSLMASTQWLTQLYNKSFHSPHCPPVLCSLHPAGTAEWINIPGTDRSIADWLLSYVGDSTRWRVHVLRTDLQV